MSYEDLVKESDRNFEYIRHLLYREYGLAHVSSEDFEEMSILANCINCGLCISVCPVVKAVGVSGFPGPRSIGISVSRALNNLAEMVDILYKCSGCNACNEVCPQKVPIKEIVIKLKNKLRKVAPKRVPEDVVKLTEPLVKYKMFYLPTSKDKKEKIAKRLLKKLSLPYIEDKFDKNAEILFYPGCKAEERLLLMKEATKIILDTLNVKWTLMENFVCCGYPAEEKGNLDELEYLQNELAKEVKKLNNVKIIVTICPGCTSSLKRIVKKKGLNVKVKHLVRFLIEDINSKNIENLIKNKNIKIKTAIQSPCNLYREGDSEILYLTKELFSLIGIELVELPLTTSCCGGGAFLPVTNKDIANKILKYKTKDFEGSNASHLLTMCPECNVQWSHGVKVFLNGKKEVLDISVLIAKLLVERSE